MANEDQRQLEVTEIREGTQITPQEMEQVSGSEEERNYEAEAVELINNIVDDQEQRAQERYGRGIFGKVQVSIFRESSWIKSDDLEETGEFVDLTKRAKAYKWGAIGLKAAGGFGAAVAMTFTGGLGAILTPSIWSVGLRKGIDAVLEAGEELVWGRKRTQKELEFQLQLSEEITALKRYLLERRENGVVSQEEFAQMIERIIDKDSEVARTQNENMTSERKWAIGRAIASSVFTIGAALFGGMPLGTHDYDKATEYTYWGKDLSGSDVKIPYTLDAKHKVLWNLKNSGQFLYNQTELETVHKLQQLRGLNQVFTDFAGRAGHTLGGSLPWQEKSALVGSFLYLFGTPLYQTIKKKKDISEMTQRTEIERRREGEGGALYGEIERRRRRREDEIPVVSKEETFDNTDPKFKFTRKAAQITLAFIDSYEKLNAENVEEGEEKFRSETRKIFKDKIVVHGLGSKKRGNFRESSDTDGNTALELFRLAGVELDTVEFVEQGERRIGKVNVDTGNRHGIVIEGTNPENPYGITFFIDHHGDESGEDLSATEIVYQYLTSMGLLQRTKNLDRLIAFVTHLDNLTGPYRNPINFRKSHRSVQGLHSFIETTKLVEFFDRGDDPTRELTNDEIKELGGEKGEELLKRSAKFAKDNMEQERKIDRLKKNGFVVNSPYGEVLIDIGGKIDKYAFAASPYRAHITWRPREQRFFISGMPREMSLKQGKRIRGMWLKPFEDRGPLRITLSEVLQEFGVNPGSLSWKLKRYLSREGRRRPERGRPRVQRRTRPAFQGA